MSRRISRSSTASTPSQQAPPTPSPSPSPPPQPPAPRPAFATLPTLGNDASTFRNTDGESPRRMSAATEAAVAAAVESRLMSPVQAAQKNANTGTALKRGPESQKTPAAGTQRDSFASQNSIQSKLQPSSQYLTKPRILSESPQSLAVPRTAAAAHDATIRSFAARSSSSRQYPPGASGGGLIAAASAAAAAAAAAAVAAAAATANSSQVGLLKPTAPPDSVDSTRRSSDASTSGPTSQDTSPSASILEVVRLNRLGRQRNSDFANPQNPPTQTRPSSLPFNPPSAFTLPPLAEELDLSRRFSSFSSSLDQEFSSESFPLKSALKTKEKSSSKRGIRFEESAKIARSYGFIEAVKEKPAIIWIVGPPAVGKNTLCKYILSEVIKRQATCSILNWPKILSRTQRHRTGAYDTSDQAITATVTTVINARKNNPSDIVLVNNFPLNLQQAQMFEKQVRNPDAILSLTASQRTLEFRWGELRRKTLPPATFLSRTEKYYKDVDPVLARYKNRVITLDADQPTSSMWDRVQEILITMEVMSGINWLPRK